MTNVFSGSLFFSEFFSIWSGMRKVGLLNVLWFRLLPPLRSGTVGNDISGASLHLYMDPRHVFSETADEQKLDPHEECNEKNSGCITRLGVFPQEVAHTHIGTVTQREEGHRNADVRGQT